MPVLKAFCLESYSEPEEVYSVVKRRGMHLVTLTDHDSLDGCEALRAHSDFFASEEVTCRMPSGTEAHIAVYDLTERQHVEIQRRKADVPALVAYLGEQDLFFAVNHIFSSVTGPRHEEDFRWFIDSFPAFETLNGHMLPETNRHAARLARRTEKVSLGGSDAHTICAAATAYTEVPGAANKDEFLAGLRRGSCRARGSSGSYAQTTRVALRVVWELLREERWPRCSCRSRYWCPRSPTEISPRSNASPAAGRSASLRLAAGARAEGVRSAPRFGRWEWRKRYDRDARGVGLYR